MRLTTAGRPARSLASTAALLLGLSMLAACQGDAEPTPEPPTSGAASDDADETDETDETGEEADGDSEDIVFPQQQIYLGDVPYVSPCQFLTPTFAVKHFPFTVEGEFTQSAYSLGLDETQLATMAGTIGGARLSSRCSYDMGNADHTTITLRVDQYADERTAAREWQEIRRYGKGADVRGSDSFSEFVRQLLEDAKEELGGVNLPGIDQRILWRTGTSEFVARSGGFLLTFSRADDYGFTPAITEKDARFAERALLAALDQAGRDDLSAATYPGYLVQDTDWPMFLDPCLILDSETTEALVGRELEEVTVRSTDASPDTNLEADSPAGRSQDNSCERRGEDFETSASLGIQYVAPEDDPETVLDSHLASILDGDPTIRPARAEEIRGAMTNGNLYDVDASYTLVLRDDGRPSYTSYFIIDRYLFELEATVPRSRRSDDAVSVGVLELSTGAELAVTKALEVIRQAEAARADAEGPST